MNIKTKENNKRVFRAKQKSVIHCRKKICGTNLFYGSTSYDPDYDPILQRHKSLDYNNSVHVFGSI